MIVAQILSSWAGSGADGDEYRAQLQDDYALGKCTCAPWSPQPWMIGTWEIACDEAIFAAIEADDTYHVLWDTPNPRPPDSAPDANEWGKLRSYLARAGMSQAQIKAAIGERDGRTRREIAAALAEWLRWQS